MAILHAQQDERCNVLTAVPTVFIAMLNHPEFARFEVSRLRKGMIGGAPCSGVLREQLADNHLGLLASAEHGQGSCKRDGCKCPVRCAGERFPRPARSLVISSQHHAGIGEAGIQNEALGIDGVQPGASAKVNHRPLGVASVKPRPTAQLQGSCAGSD
ncbi:MAG TPA: hypothetical protein VH855_13255 [Acetobacteraceae bacterium]